MIWEPSAVDTSLIATGAALLGILVTNQAKVSEFRQQWINALRDDAAILITHTFRVHSAKAGEDIDESCTLINQISARLRLRLNPKEKETHAVILAMNNMRDANHNITDFARIKEYVNEFVVAVQRVLKKEWRRVKWGEPLYRIGVAVVVAALLFSLWTYLHPNPTSNPAQHPSTQQSNAH
ncbi:MAG: hypothetical protein ABR928_18575 [Terracidiphilus sp.]|jgi:hypothetical protein